MAMDELQKAPDERMSFTLPEYTSDPPDCSIRSAAPWSLPNLYISLISLSHLSATLSVYKSIFQNTDSVCEEHEMTRLSSTCLIAAILATTFSAAANEEMNMREGEMSMGMMDMKMMDKNADGMVSEDEFMEANEKMFSKMDKNKDGMMDAEEQKKMKGMMK
ncbi:MAG: hypothetical protein H0W33_01055 [Gammaproteobacteria bacterium]|nr:hypothetical protein [Gammaproteobacteria bacterium]